jgi:hypothetical protein
MVLKILVCCLKQILSSKLKTDRLQQLMSGQDKGKEKDYIDFFEDMEKSVYGAAQSLGYSFGDLNYNWCGRSC